MTTHEVMHTLFKSLPPEMQFLIKAMFQPANVNGTLTLSTKPMVITLNGWTVNVPTISATSSSPPPAKEAS